MSNILCLYEQNMPTITLFREQIANALGAKTISIHDVSLEDLVSSDALIFIRPNDCYSVSLAKIARKTGRLVAVYFDDDLLNLPKTHPAMPWRRKAMTEIISNADIISSSNKHILEKYSKAFNGKRSAEIGVVIDGNEFAEVKRNAGNDIVKLVYAAGACHKEIFEKFVVPVMPKLCEKYNGKISITFVGVHPNADSLKEYINVEYVAGMSLDEYRKYMAEQQFDIGLAPLNDDEFSRCKYFNKYVEYTTSGIVGVYSKVEPYTFVIKDKENGFLTDNTDEAWYNSLCIAIENANLRRQCLGNARKHLTENFSQQAVIAKLKKDIPELFTESKEKKEIKCSLWLLRMKYKIFRLFDCIYLSLFYLKKLGLKGLIEKIKAHYANKKVWG